MLNRIIYITILTSVIMLGCHDKKKHVEKQLTAADILGNPEYTAISYSGYRKHTRDIQPTVEEFKDDMRILAAMGVKIFRTYNVYLDQASNVLKAITELKAEDPNFEMYMMLGAWIDCKNAWTDQAPDHEIESERNAAEIDRAVALANKYPDIVKIIAVGNEAMVHWAESYFVRPQVILKWVNHLQALKASGKLPETLWITSSDDFSSWGGGDPVYHTKDLEELIKAVDYISMHTYPMHNTHYNPHFWLLPENEKDFPKAEQVNRAMKRALDFAQNQYDSVSNYMKSLGINKPIHIGETGWASIGTDLYGDDGSRAMDEYKAGEYYKLMREWTDNANISCFYFQAFNEPWKDAQNPLGSENHFGLFTVEGQAKYAVWDLVDQGLFKGLTRDGHTIKKTQNGNLEAIKAKVLAPPTAEVFYKAH